MLLMNASVRHVAVEDRLSSPALEGRDDAESDNEKNEEDEIGQDGNKENDPLPARRFGVEVEREGGTSLILAFGIIKVGGEPSGRIIGQVDNVAGSGLLRLDLPSGRYRNIVGLDELTRRVVVILRSLLFNFRIIIEIVFIHLHDPSIVSTRKVHKTKNRDDSLIRLVESDGSVVDQSKISQEDHRAANRQ